MSNEENLVALKERFQEEYKEIQQEIQKVSSEREEAEELLRSFQLRQNKYKKLVMLFDTYIKMSNSLIDEYNKMLRLKEKEEKCLLDIVEENRKLGELRVRLDASLRKFCPSEKKSI